MIMGVEFKGVFAQFVTSLGVASLVAVIGVLIGLVVNLIGYIHNKMLNQKSKGFIVMKENTNENHN